MSRYSNRNWGMSQAVLTRISKTVLFSSLYYGNIVWINNSTLTEINKLWYKIAKSAVGAVFNVNGCILDVILGVPPPHVMSRLITTKHYLKVFSGGNDIHKEFIINQLNGGNIAVQFHLKDVQKFLKWRTTSWKNEPNVLDSEVFRSKELIPEVPRKYFKYTKIMMDKFTETLWQETLENELMMQGWIEFPKVSCQPLPIPRNISRDKEVLIMSLFYENNLLNSFLFKFDKNRWTSPDCTCGFGEQDALHLLTHCNLVEDRTKEKLSHLIEVCNQNKLENISNSVVTILNCSRDPEFINNCLEVIETDGLRLKTKISLSKKKSRNDG